MATRMRTVSFKLPTELDERLSQLAQARQTTRSALAREALEAFTDVGDRSVVARAGDLVGALEGPPDLSTNDEHLAGYGE